MARRSGKRWYPPRHRAALRELQRRTEAMALGDFQALGQSLDGPPQLEHLRQALDVLGTHVEQFHQGMHAYVQAFTTAQESERERIARDLHDDTVQRLVALGQGVDRVHRLWDRDPEAAHARLQTLRGEITGVIQGLRRIIGDLRPPALDDLGLVPALRQLVTRSHDAEPAVDITVEGNVRRLDGPSELAVFRIVQEAWSNVHRHANAQHVHIHLMYGQTTLTVTVCDNGQGFSQAGWTEPRGSWGLQGIHERATVIGGTVQLTSEPGHGTRLELSVPYLGRGGRDPVCGMEVAADGLTTEHDDHLYRFCSPACRDIFVTTPEQFIRLSRNPT